jgi:hypothetical protein
LDFEPRPAGKSDVFVRSSEPFTGDMGKVTPAADQERQVFFEDQLRRIAWHLGSDTIPVFLDFNGDKRRMDKGCVGHAVASGLLAPPTNGPGGFVTHVQLAGVRPDSGLELWAEYKREEIAPLFGLQFTTGAWNQGFVVQGQHAFLLVTLDKSGHHDDHNYDDRFLSPTRFRWQSQNRTAQQAHHGQIISQQAPGYSIHLLVRPTKLANSVGAPFVYCGEVDFESWQGERPITVTWQLRQPVPEHLFDALGVDKAG